MLNLETITPQHRVLEAFISATRLRHLLGAREGVYFLFFMILNVVIWCLLTLILGEVFPHLRIAPYSVWETRILLGQWATLPIFILLLLGVYSPVMKRRLKLEGINVSSRWHWRGVEVDRWFFEKFKSELKKLELDDERSISILLQSFRDEAAWKSRPTPFVWGVMAIGIGLFVGFIQPVWEVWITDAQRAEGNGVLGAAAYLGVSLGFLAGGSFFVVYAMKLSPRTRIEACIQVLHAILLERTSTFKPVENKREVLTNVPVTNPWKLVVCFALGIFIGRFR